MHLQGCGPTVLRAMTVNATQLATYSQSKEALLSSKFFEEGMMLQFASSMISGFATTVASMPIDIVKTRLITLFTQKLGFVQIFARLIIAFHLDLYI